MAHPSMNLPAYTGFKKCIHGRYVSYSVCYAVACGAVSGFHSLVSSGTSSKTISNEKDMLKVGYGAMVLESLLAVLPCVWQAFAAGADGTPAVGTPFQIFSAGVAGFLEMFGIPMYVAQCFMTMCVSALALQALIPLQESAVCPFRSCSVQMIWNRRSTGGRWYAINILQL